RGVDLVVGPASGEELHLCLEVLVPGGAHQLDVTRSGLRRDGGGSGDLAPTWATKAHVEPTENPRHIVQPEVLARGAGAQREVDRDPGPSVRGGRLDLALALASRPLTPNHVLDIKEPRLVFGEENAHGPVASPLGRREVPGPDPLRCHRRGINDL